MDRERFEILTPPPNGLQRLRRSLRERRARKVRRRITAAVLLPLACTALLLVRGATPVERPDHPRRVTDNVEEYDTRLHPALAVLDGGPLAAVSLRGELGTLTAIPTAQPDVLLYLVGPR